MTFIIITRRLFIYYEYIFVIHYKRHLKLGTTGEGVVRIRYRNNNYHT